MYKLFPIILLSIVLLNNCSSCNKKGNVFKIFPLSTVEKKITPSTFWNISIGNGAKRFHVNLHPTYIDGNRTIYAADHKGIVKAVNIDNGKEIWKTDLSGRNRGFSYASALLSGGVTAYNGRVYVGSEKAKVYALNDKDGSIVWETSVCGEVLSRPTVTDGLVLVHTANGHLQALNEEDGVVKWVLYLDVPLRLISFRGDSTPSVAHGIAVVGDKNGKISAISIQEGEIIWKQQIFQSIGNREIDRLHDINASPIIINNIVYAIAYNGNLVALELSNGKIIWSCKVGSLNDFVVNGNCIYLSDQYGKILAIDAKNGEVLWTKDFLLHRFLTAPVFYRGMLVVADQEGYVYWLNPKNGRCIAKKKINISGFMSDPVIAGNKILIQTKEGMLYAITC